MIVRDEEEYLDACLASLDGVVDELVVVDTGSRDRTVAIAEDHGARLLRHAWAGDFAEARNVALASTTGDSVLPIDPDEGLAPVPRSRVEELLGTPEEIALTVP